MPSKIQPHDVAAGTQWPDMGTLTSREVDTKMVKRSLIVAEGLKMEKISIDASYRPFLHFKNQEG